MASKFTWKVHTEGNPMFLDDYTEMEEMYDKIQQLHWVAKEINYSTDAFDWQTLDMPTKTYLKRILTFFSQADFLVVDLLEYIEPHIKGNPSVEFYLIEQKAQEQVHAITYLNQIKALGLVFHEVDGIIRQFKEDPILISIFTSIKDMAKQYPVELLLILDAFVEGVLFQGAFATIQWIRNRNILKGITLANEFITRDEGLHTLAICHMYKYVKDEHKATFEQVQEIAKKIMNFAVEFIANGIGINMPGLTTDSMKDYIMFQTDCVSQELGYNRIFNVNNPYSFMDTIALNSVIKCNFFEVTGASYGEIESSDAMKIGLIEGPIEC